MAIFWSSSVIDYDFGFGAVAGMSPRLGCPDVFFCCVFAAPTLYLGIPHVADFALLDVSSLPSTVTTPEGHWPWLSAFVAKIALY